MSTPLQINDKDIVAKRLHNFNQTLKARPYRRQSYRIRQQKIAILQQLIAIPHDSSIALRHWPQVVAAVDKTEWYNTDYALNHILFAGMSLLSYHQPQRLKGIAHQHHQRWQAALNYTDINVNDPKAVQISQHYSFLLTTDILQALWQSPELRHAIGLVLKAFVNNKEVSGAEIEANWHVTAHKIQRIQQLLAGTVKQETIQLPAKYRLPKQTLTQLNWINALKHYPITLGFEGLWD